MVRIAGVIYMEISGWMAVRSYSVRVVASSFCEQ